MTIYDGIAEANGDDDCRAWLRKSIDAKDEIVAFVDGRLDGGGAGEFIGSLKGSFNLSLRIGFGDRQQSALRLDSTDRSQTAPASTSGQFISKYSQAPYTSAERNKWYHNYN